MRARASNKLQSTGNRKKILSIVTSAIALFTVSVSLTGCFKEWSTAEVQEWYEEKPKDYDDYMRVARKKIGEGQTDRGLQLYKDCISDLEAQYGDSDVRIGTTAEELGVLDEKLGRTNDAEWAFRKAYDVRIKNLPPNHLDVKRSKQKLSSVLKKLGRDDEARQIMSDGKKDSTTASSSSSSSEKKPAVRVRRHKLAD